MRMNPMMIKISAVILTMLLIGACSNDQAAPPAEQPPAVSGGGDSGNAPGSAEDPSAKPQEDQTATPDGGKELSVGETGVVGDTIDYYGIVITLNGLRESEGDDYKKPQDGNMFKVVDLTVKNNGTEQVVISSALSFALTDDQEVQYTPAISSDVQTLDGTIAPGEELKGEISYEVAKDAKGLQLSFGDPMKMDRAVWNLE